MSVKNLTGKELAVKEIIELYRDDENYFKSDILEALGNAGGTDAVNNIVKIYNAEKNYFKADVLKALAQAGKNSSE